MVVGLGALGVVTRLTLDVEPAYEVRQRVFEELAWDALFEHFDAITGSGYSVSVLSYLGETVDQVWVRSRVTEAPEVVREDLFGARPATVDRHPILGLDPVNCTPQLGRPGAWSARLPYFRMGFTPSAGEELQSEYLVPREHAAAAIEAVRALADRIRPVLHVCEIRTIAADRLWMSPQYGRDSVGIHFTWALEPEAVDARARRPRAGARAVRPAPALGQALPARRRATSACADFARLAETLDPRGAFRNAWLEARVLGHSMTATTFGIIGSGWRSAFFLRLARAAPDRFRATGVVTRSAERGAEITAQWGVPAFGSAAELLRRGGARLRDPVRPLGGDARRHARARRPRRPRARRDPARAGPARPAGAVGRRRRQRPRPGRRAVPADARARGAAGRRRGGRRSARRPPCRSPRRTSTTRSR